LQAKKIVNQFLKYGLAGIVVYIIDLATYLLIIYIDETQFLAGNIAGRCVGAVASFILHRNWTFKSSSHQNDALTQGVLTFCLFAFNLLCSSLLLNYAVIDLEFDGKVSRILIDVAMILFSFIFNKIVIFRGH